MQIVSPDKLDLSTLIRPGDTVVWGQACGEPQTLTELLVAQRAAIGHCRLFIGASFSATFSAEHADHFSFVSTGAIGKLRGLAAAGVLQTIPLHVSSCERAFRDGSLASDVVFVQVAPPDENGRYSLGLVGDWIRTAARRARLVIVEVNRQVPQVRSEEALGESDIQIRIDTDRPLLQLKSSPAGESEQAIARAILNYIPDRAVIQIGIGSVPDAFVPMLKHHKGLGVHSGLIGDGIADLMEAGAVTNEFKEIDRGETITGAPMGTDRLYRFCDRNPAVRLSPATHTHDISVISRLSRFVAVNSAIEVDLTGQVNAEAVGGAYLGAVGGQLDFGRGAAASPGGRSIIALPSIASKGQSRIVANLSGPVTTPRSDADVIVTEFGSAELRTKTLPERAQALIKIAHPSHREGLERSAFEGGLKG